MHYSEELKVAWFTPQRTGTRSTREILRVLNFKTCDHHFEVPENYEEYFMVANIRNPYHRMPSLYYLYCNNNRNFDMKFNDFLDLIFNNQKLKIGYQLDYENTIMSSSKPFDKFIRTESLELDLKSLSFIDLNNSDIAKVFDEHIHNNPLKKEFSNEMNSDKKPWKDFYNQEIADYVYDNLKKQFEFFGYNKDSWKEVE